MLRASSKWKKVNGKRYIEGIMSCSGPIWIPDTAKSWASLGASRHALPPSIYYKRADVLFKDNRVAFLYPRTVNL